MDKGQHLLAALGFDAMLTSTRRKNNPLTSKSCLEWIIEIAEEKKMWATETLMARNILDRMVTDAYKT